MCNVTVTWLLQMHLATNHNLAFVFPLLPHSVRYKVTITVLLLQDFYGNTTPQSAVSKASSLRSSVASTARTLSPEFQDTRSRRKKYDLLAKIITKRRLFRLARFEKKFNLFLRQFCCHHSQCKIKFCYVRRSPHIVFTWHYPAAYVFIFNSLCCLWTG